MKKVNIIIIAILMLFVACEDQNMEAFDKLDRYQVHIDSARQVEKTLSRSVPVDNSGTVSGARVEVNEPPFASYPLRLFNRRDKSQNTIDSEYSNNVSSWQPNGALDIAATKRGDLATGVEAAVSDGTMFTFFTGAGKNDFRIYTTLSSDGSNWSTHVLPSSFKTTKKMGAVHYDDELYLFHTAATNENNLYWGKYDGGTNWTHLGQVPNVNVYGDSDGIGSTYDNSRIAVDAIVFDTRLFVFYADDGEIRCSYSSISGSAGWPGWTDELVASDPDGYIAIESVVFNGRVYVFFANEITNRLYFISSSNPTSPSSWTSATILWDKRTADPLSATVFKWNNQQFDDRLILAYKGYQGDDNIWWAQFDGTTWTDRGHTGYRTGESPEVIMYEDPNPNLALGASASATSTFPGYSVSKVNDGDTNTTVGGSYSWTNNHPAGGWLPEYVTLDLGSSMPINSVILYTSSGYELQDYDLQFSNSGSMWLTYVPGKIRGNTSNKRTVSFSPALTARYVRIKCITGPSIQTIYGRINEIEVY